MAIYLHDIPLPEAQGRLNFALEVAGCGGILGVETIALDQKAVGRVLAGAVWARISSPHYHASAMDGFAVRSLDTETAMPNNPVTLVCSSQAQYVDTGDSVPAWADAVIPIENVEPVSEVDKPATDPRHPHAVRIRAAITPWSHVRPLGEDMVATQLVLPSGHTLRPIDLGAIAACGHAEVQVARRPRVAIIPTGSELVYPGQPVEPGNIIEFNSLVLAAQVEGWGGIAERFRIVADDLDAICRTVKDAAKQHDLVLLNAGSSAGSEDFSAKTVEQLGDLLMHGVSVRPGHPVILGMLRGEERQIPIIGVPGYPVSAALTGEIFVEPLIARWLGRAAYQPIEITARLTRKVTSPAGDDDYMRVAVGEVGGQLLAAPLARGAGVVTSLVRADGITVIPRGSQGLPAGAEVRVRLYRSPSEIANTILAIGSHDITLDLMAQFLAGRHRRLVSANVGSLGGLISLQRGESHLAGAHLLDANSGEYNLSFVREYLSGIPVKVVALVGRQQGLMVQRGNPKQIYDLEHLIEPGVTFINRQRGAGTRVLLDYQLGRKGIASQSISGYNQEEYTHLAVAAAISSGRADCGMGIAAAADALDLEFIPLYQERYDLIIPTRDANSTLLAPLFDLLADPSFRQAVAALPGYDVELMGRLVAEME